MEKKFKILFVDDEMSFVEPLAKLFEAKGYEIKIVNSGEDGIKALQESIPDIMFVDFMMPGMDGYEVMKKVRELHYELPIILMSSYLEDTVGKQFSSYSNYQVFCKHDEFSKVLGLVESFLKK